jgi:hypothetical protein
MTPSIVLRTIGLLFTPPLYSRLYYCSVFLAEVLALDSSVVIIRDWVVVIEVWMGGGIVLRVTLDRRVLVGVFVCIEVVVCSVFLAEALVLVVVFNCNTWCRSDGCMVINWMSMDVPCIRTMHIDGSVIFVCTTKKRCIAQEDRHYMWCIWNKSQKTEKSRLGVLSPVRK